MSNEQDDGEQSALTQEPLSAGAVETQDNRLYRRVVYARVTDEEWKSVLCRAKKSGLSMSRYLVRSALAKRPPLTREERRQAEDRLYRMRRTAIRLRQLAGLRWMQSADPETVEMFRETAALLEQMVQDMTRRLYGKGRQP